MTVITDIDRSLILKRKDKEVVLKSLLEENNFKPESVGVTNWETYETGFKNRNGYSVADIKKSLKDQGVTEINEEGVDKVFNLMNISKAEGLEPATEGIIYALITSLSSLYNRSQWRLESFTDNFDNADLVRSINLFVFYVKMIKDDLGFITYNDGQIATVPITTTIAKYWDDYDDYYYNDPSKVNSWEVNQINDINKELRISILLLDSLMKIFPDNPDFDFFKTILETGLDVMREFQLNFPNIVILANQKDLIRVEPKTISPKAEPVVFYNDPVTKSKLVKKKYYDVSVVKNDTEFEGLVTGIVYAPDTKDADGNYASAEVIEKAMRTFMTDYYQFDVMHDLNVLKSDKGEGRQVALIQNFIAPQDLTYGDRIVKKGTWIQETQYFDEEIKKKIADGTYNGYSLYGLADIATT